MILQKSWRSGLAVACGLAIYAAAIAWLLASSTSQLYGFPVRPGLQDLLAACSQMCPLLAALVFLTLDTSVRKLVGPALGVLLLAGLFTAVITYDVLYVSHGSNDGLPAMAQAWSYAGLSIDLLLVGIFTSFVAGAWPGFGNAAAFGLCRSHFTWGHGSASRRSSGLALRLLQV